VQEAYLGLLVTGRYPVAFLFLQLPPEEVDVNAHPAKSEVRFCDRDALYRLVLGAVRERLREADLTARVRLNGGKVYQPIAQANAGTPTGDTTPARTAAAETLPPSAAPASGSVNLRSAAPVPSSVVPAPSALLSSGVAPAVLLVPVGPGSSRSVQAQSGPKYE
jgi:DNA mismatch repair protein MutL